MRGLEAVVYPPAAPPSAFPSVEFIISTLPYNNSDRVYNINTSLQ